LDITIVPDSNGTIFLASRCDYWLLGADVH